jgi:hypothetical protein
VQGRWLAQGNATPLVVGSAVVPGSVLVAPAPAALDHIVVIAARTGHVLVSRRCTTAVECRRPLPVPRGPDTGGAEAWTSDLLAQVMALFIGEPDRYVATLSRGAPNLDDAVLTWRDGVVDLAPVLTSLPSAPYLLSLWPMDCGSDHACSDTPLDLRVDWPLERADAAVLAETKPGLYELVISRGKAPHLDAAAGAFPVVGGMQGRARCWVLVVAAADKAAAETRHREALALAAGWGTMVDPQVKQGFVRAALDALVRR